MEKKIKLFLEFLQKDKKLSNNTLQSYKRDITQYESYINEENLQYLKVTKDDIKKYLENLKNIGKKTSTISRNLASIRSFYQYLVRTKKIKEDPTEGIQSPKVEKRVPSVLSSKEVELLLEQPKAVDLKGIRDKAMLEFAYATGMRVTEIINLNIEDVNLKEGYVSCTNANKQRNIPLGAISINAFLVSCTLIIILSLYFSKFSCSKLMSCTITTFAPLSKASFHKVFPSKFSPFIPINVSSFFIFLVSLEKFSHSKFLSP